MADFLMRFDELERALGARLVSLRDEGFSSVCVDSRLASEGALFVALPGGTEDGHRYVEDAFKAGAAGAMVGFSALEDLPLALEKTAKKWNRTLIAVENTLRGLQDAAGAYLRKFPSLLKIGITGSAGKTTTKEIAAAIIGREKRVVMNDGNLNSETGLPLSVFKVEAEHQVGIFEMGMNRRGEIAELARVLCPNIALVTNIGTAHIGILGSRDAIAEEKKKIFSEFTGGETALIPAEDPYRNFLAADIPGNVFFYGGDFFDELGAVSAKGIEGTEIIWNGLPLFFPLPGKHNFDNALAALALARAAGAGAAAIREGLTSVKPLFGRGEICRGEVTVIRDCYNSNPEGAAAAVEFCAGLDWPGRKVYVIGSMLELGAASGESHRKLGGILAGAGADKVFLYGPETKPAAEALEEAGASYYFTDTMDELSRALGGYIRPGDLVLLKGSRACALEKLDGVLDAARGGGVRGIFGVPEFGLKGVF